MTSMWLRSPRPAEQTHNRVQRPVTIMRKAMRDDLPNDFPMVESPPAAADEPSEKLGVPSNGIVSS